MKTRKVLIASIVAAGMLAAVPLAYGGPGGRGDRGHGGPRMHAGFGAGMLFGHLRHLREELDLSDQQAEQIRAIFAETHEQNAQYREQLHGGMKGAFEALLADPNNLSAAQAALDQQAAAERAMKSNMLVATSKALNVLTAEQRTELGKLVQEHSQRRAGRRGRR